jgi:hypothetical protein
VTALMIRFPDSVTVAVRCFNCGTRYSSGWTVPEGYGGRALCADCGCACGGRGIIHETPACRLAEPEQLGFAL